MDGNCSPGAPPAASTFFFFALSYAVPVNQVGGSSDHLLSAQSAILEWTLAALRDRVHAIHGPAARRRGGRIRPRLGRFLSEPRRRGLFRFVTVQVIRVGEPLRAAAERDFPASRLSGRLERRPGSQARGPVLP